MTTVNENKSNTEGSDKTQQNQASSNNGQHEGECNDKEQDVEIQENINEDDFIEGLDVVDTWDDDEKDKPRRRSWDRSRGRDRRNSRDRERELDRDRDNHRARRRSRSNDRRRSRSHERKRDPSRRDPNKSSKDIEQDKLRTKKDNDSKMLAEKEKAIKTLLDSDEVVPPGTEGEAIQNMVDKNHLQQQEDEDRKKKNNERNSRENRRRSPIRNRLGYRRFSPRRSPIRRSPARRSPITFSPDRRRRSPDDRRRKSSIDRETSLERKEASRRRLRERYGRGRSRSRDRRSVDRHRSRSLDRHRRSSRSPFDRHSPRRRRRSLSRSPLRSPTRSRRRSPFINELARQFQNDPIRTDNVMPPQQMAPMHAMGPGAPPYMPPVGPQQMMPPGLLPTPPQGMMTGPPGMLHGAMDMHQGPMAMHPVPVMGPGPGAGLPYGGYDACPPGPPVMNFDPLNGGPPPANYSSGPIIYNQGNPIPINPHPMQPPLSPQPVPAPGQGAPGPMYAGPPLGSAMQHQPPTVPGPKYSPNAAYNAKSPALDAFKSRREGRMKTPEPPIISDFKPNDKTSLSSLLEASVSAKDSSNLTASFKGFKPELIRFCERALRNLPAEDPRLRMKGRFFFDPSKKDCKNDKKEITSNSILLRKGRTEIHWDEEERQLSSTQQQPTERKRVITHQKICQTEEATRESIGIQAETPMTDAVAQVYPHDFLSREERRGADDGRPRGAMTDRLDWSMRETFDHSAKLRENEDLRWTLNNNSRDRPAVPWGRGFSPSRQPIVNDHLHGNAGPGAPLGGLDGLTRGGSMDMRGGLDMMRDRGGLERMMDARERMMDPRERAMDIRDAEARERDLRAMELMRDRERLAEPRMGMMELGGRGGGIDSFPARREPLDDFSRGAGLRESRDEYTRDEYARDEFARDEFARDARPGIEDFDMRKGLTAGFTRAMASMDRERGDAAPRGGRSDSPVMLDEDPEELEIIEERGFDREQPWQPRNSGDSLAQFKPVRATASASLGVIGNNAAGAAMRGNAAVKRSFRGRIGGFRSNF